MKNFFLYLLLVSPHITGQPVHQVVTEGQKATFSVTATGTALSYQWQWWNGVSWENVTSGRGETSASYTTKATTYKDNGAQFQCVLTTSGESVTSDVANLTVNLVAPVLKGQPLDLAVTEGEKASFSVTATGTALSYQWQWWNGLSWEKVAAGSGATTGSFTTWATTDNDNGRQFRCLVMNSGGYATSDVANLTVDLVAPVITAQPRSQVVTEWQTANFSMTATGTALSYQWQRWNGASWENATDGSGATTAFYTTWATTDRDNGAQLRCEVTNRGGGITSSAATMTVILATPAIAEQPRSQVLTEWQTANFSVTATGTALSYQWQRWNGVSWENVTAGSGGTTAFYTTWATTYGDNGAQFRCVVTNRLPVTVGGFANDAVEKEVSFAPQEGRYIRLLALSEVNGNPWTTMAEINILSYGLDGSTEIPQAGWLLSYVDSQEVVREDGAAVNAFDGNEDTFWHTAYNGGSPPPPHEIQIDFGGTYNINGFRYLPRQDGVDNGRIGQYEFYISTDGINWGGGRVESSVVNLTVNLAVPVVTVDPANQVVNEGQAANFSVSVKGSELTYQWQRLESGGGEWTNVGTNSPIYTTAATTRWDNGAKFKVLVTNAAGSVSSNEAILTVNVLPAITVQPMNQLVTVGQAATFSVTAEGAAPLYYQWQRQENGGWAWTNVGTNSPFYTTAVTTRWDNGAKFKVMVTNMAGGVSSNEATLTLDYLPDWRGTPYGPFVLTPYPGIAQPVLKAQNVTDISAGIVADPFLFYDKGLWHLFFEATENPSGLGRIGLATSPNGLQWTYKKIVLKENFHLSFPQVFSHNGQHFMIPETSQAYSVRLYRATNFPEGWQLVSTLIQGRPFVDPQIVRYNNTWWIFVSDTSNGNCYLYYSDNLTSGWTQHPWSPVVRGTDKARGGGRVFVYNGEAVIRLAQDDSNSYGRSVRAFQVDTLTRTSYSEHEIPQSPVLRGGSAFWNQGGMHHLDPWWTGSGWLCAVDGYHAGYDWSIGIYTTTP